MIDLKVWNLGVDLNEYKDGQKTNWWTNESQDQSQFCLGSLKYQK